MKSASGYTCATCKFFPIEKAAESDGRAQCELFPRRRPDWDDGFCVVYERDRPNIRQRGRVIEILKEKTKK